MNNNEIEKRLASAIEASAPDMLDSLMDELDLNGANEPSMHDRLAENKEDRYEPVKARRINLRALVSCAAALVLLIGGITVWKNAGSKVMAVVDLDVNPGIELTINAKEKVVEAISVNEDGDVILADMDLRGSDVKVACNAIIGSMLMNGYLNDQSNSILLSVYAEDAAKGTEIEEQLSGYINDYMENSSVAAAIMGQCIDGDDELIEFARNNAISPGKAWLIRKLLDSGGKKMTEESLLALSTQELIMLSQERNVQSDTTYGKASGDGYIDRDSALAAALAYAGLDIAQVTDVEVEMDCEYGQLIYEVEFNHGGYEYEYDIEASTGEVIESESENASSSYDVDDDDDDWDDDDGDDWDDDDDDDHDDWDDDDDDRDDDDDDDDDRDDDDDDDDD